MQEIFIGNIKGEKGDTGQGLTIIDYYASAEELSAAITSPSPGDTYGVGSVAPYDIYVYSTSNGWVNNGQLQGAKGDKGDSGTDGINATITGVTATVDETTGTPTVNVTMGGTESERSFDFAFSGLKGEKGDSGTTATINIDEQTPTYTEAATLETLTSGEKISIAFGKIKKAITDFISHSNDNTKHITSTERTTWNENTTNITNIQAEIENAAKIATGFYTGSNTAGADNKSKLQFAFVPKYVIVQGSYARGEVMCVAYAKFIYGINHTFYHEHRQDDVVEQACLAVSWNDEDKSLSWNITDSTHSAVEQLNASGIQYSYVAIG